MNIEIEKEKLLLVEGKDEEYVFGVFCRQLKIMNVQIICYEGKNNLKNKINAVMSTPGFEKVRSIGIEQDGNDDSQATFQSIKDILKNCRLPFPLECGIPVKEDSIQINVFIMPDCCQSNGMLEDLFLKSIEAERIYIECIVPFLECAKEISHTVVKSKNPIYAYISTKEHPDIRLGISVKKEYWNLEHPCFHELKNFLLSL